MIGDIYPATAFTDRYQSIANSQVFTGIRFQLTTLQLLHPAVCVSFTTFTTRMHHGAVRIGIQRIFCAVLDLVVNGRHIYAIVITACFCEIRMGCIAAGEIDYIVQPRYGGCGFYSSFRSAAREKKAAGCCGNDCVAAVCCKILNGDALCCFFRAGIFYKNRIFVMGYLKQEGCRTTGGPSSLLRNSIQ